MGEAIGNVLPMAIGVAISPIPVIAVVLMLGDAARAPTALRSLSAGSPA